MARTTPTDARWGRPDYLKIRLNKYGGIDAENNTLTHAYAPKVIRLAMVRKAQRVRQRWAGQRQAHVMARAPSPWFDDRTARGYRHPQKSFCGGVAPTRRISNQSGSAVQGPRHLRAPREGDAIRRTREGARAFTGRRINFDTATEDENGVTSHATFPRRSRWRAKESECRRL